MLPNKNRMTLSACYNENSCTFQWWSKVFHSSFKNLTNWKKLIKINNLCIICGVGVAKFSKYLFFPSICLQIKETLKKPRENVCAINKRFKNVVLTKFGSRFIILHQIS